MNNRERRNAVIEQVQEMSHKHIVERHHDDINITSAFKAKFLLKHNIELGSSCCAIPHEIEQEMCIAFLKKQVDQLKKLKEQ
jgi:hypothetical protein